jgi:hypothetical protein
MLMTSYVEMPPVATLQAPPQPLGFVKEAAQGSLYIPEALCLLQLAHHCDC